MTDTEAGFALLPDRAIVSFVRKHHNTHAREYEVICACRVLGSDLLKKYKLLDVWEQVRPRCPECHVGLCACGDCHQVTCKHYVAEDA